MAANFLKVLPLISQQKNDRFTRCGLQKVDHPIKINIFFFFGISQTRQ